MQGPLSISVFIIDKLTQLDEVLYIKRQSFASGDLHGRPISTISKVNICFPQLMPR